MKRSIREIASNDTETKSKKRKLENKGVNEKASISDNNNIFEINEMTKTLFTALVAAEGQVETVKLLVDKYKANPHAPLTDDDDRGCTPIYGAAARDQVETVKLLINKYKADPHAPLTDGGEKGCTPIYEAATKGQVEIVKLLI